MIKILIILSIIFSVINCQTGNYPASGLYVGLSSNFLTNEGVSLTNYAQNEITSMSLPDISGSSSSADYTFSSFKLAATLDDIFYNELSEGIYQIGWQTITFNLQWNYHICANTIFNPCENGDISVFTTDGATASIASNLDVVFNTSSTTITATTTQFVFGQGDVQVNVHCSNAICVIPVSDIANEVAQNFVNEATAGITKAINEQVPNIVSLLNPIKQVPVTFSNGDSLWIDLEGQLVEQSNPVANMPTLTAAFYGGIILENTDGNFIYPTQQPTYVPSDDQLESFTSDYCVSISGFFVESLCDASFASLLPITFNPSEVPSASPVQLNTSDGFFSSVAPGLSQYPNLGIQVNVYSPVTPLVSVNSTGINLSNLQVSADFIILDSNNPFTAFTVLFTIDAEVSSSLQVVSSNTFSLNSTLVSMNPNATISSSSIGGVDASGFVQLMQMIQSVIKIPSLVYTIPSKYSITSPNLSFIDQLIQVTFDLTTSSSSTDLNNNNSFNPHHPIINFN